MFFGRKKISSAVSSSSSSSSVLISGLHMRRRNFVSLQEQQQNRHLLMRNPDTGGGSSSMNDQQQAFFDIVKSQQESVSLAQFAKSIVDSYSSAADGAAGASELLQEVVDTAPPTARIQTLKAHAKISADMEKFIQEQEEEQSRCHDDQKQLDNNDGDDNDDTLLGNASDKGSVVSGQGGYVVRVCPADASILCRSAETLRRGRTLRYSLERSCRKTVVQFVDSKLLPILSNASCRGDVLGAVNDSVRLAARAGIAELPMRVWVAAIFALGVVGDSTRLQQLVDGLTDPSSAPALPLRLLCARLPADGRVALLSCYQRQLHVSDERHLEVLGHLAEIVAEELPSTAASSNSSKEGAGSTSRRPQYSSLGPLLSFQLLSRILISLTNQLAAFLNSEQPLSTEDAKGEEHVMQLSRSIFLGTLRRVAAADASILAATTSSSSSSSSGSAFGSCSFRKVDPRVDNDAGVLIQVSDPRAASACVFLEAAYQLLLMSNSGAYFVTEPETLTLLGAAISQLLPFLAPKDVHALMLCANILEHLLSLGCLRPALDAASIWAVSFPELVDHTTFPLSLAEGLILAARTMGEEHEHLAALLRLQHSRDWLHSVVRGDKLHRGMKGEFAAKTAVIINSAAHSDGAFGDDDDDASDSSSSAAYNNPLQSAWFSTRSSGEAVECALSQDDHEHVVKFYGMAMAPGGMFVPFAKQESSSMLLK